MSLYIMSAERVTELLSCYLSIAWPTLARNAVFKQPIVSGMCSAIESRNVSTDCCEINLC